MRRTLKDIAGFKITDNIGMYFGLPLTRDKYIILLYMLYMWWTNLLVVYPSMEGSL